MGTRDWLRRLCVVVELVVVLPACSGTTSKAMDAGREAEFDAARNDTVADASPIDAPLVDRGQTDGQVPDAHGDGCPSEPQAEKSCLLGAAFAACPGRQAPRGFCGKFGCLWVSNGCPLANRPVELTANCICSAPSGCWPEAYPVMAHFWKQRGGAAWTRTKDMNLSVTWGGKAATGPSLRCKGCTGACLQTTNPCSGLVDGKQSFPGTFVQTFRPQGGLSGWFLELEVDLAAKRARVCRLRFTDSLSSCAAGSPVCASSGFLKIDIKPTPALVGSVRGTFSATFPDGVTIDGDL